MFLSIIGQLEGLGQQVAEPLRLPLGHLLRGQVINGVGLRGVQDDTVTSTEQLPPGSGAASMMVPMGWSDHSNNQGVVHNAVDVADEADRRVNLGDGHPA